MIAPEHIMTAQLLDRFGVAGINYHKADACTRGLFAVTREDVNQISILARKQQLRSVFVLSTCNRTEIYGFSEDVRILVSLLTTYTRGTEEEFLEFAYLKTGEDALDHLYEVASGLDSQILGDYEILGQLKKGVELAMRNDSVGPIMNRTVNFAVQASKKIKTETSISTGTVSVSYAAIELLKELDDIASRSILVIGAGKFGANVCKNLVNYLPDTLIRVANRTDATAQLLSEDIGVSHVPYEALEQGIADSDIVIVCTNAAEPTVDASHFSGSRNRLVLDLSIPMNVAAGVRELEHVRVINVDEISQNILDKNFARRKAQIPRAREIIRQSKHDFLAWLNEYRYSLHLKSWKDKLQELQPAACNLDQHAAQQPGDRNIHQPMDRKAQQAVSKLAVNLRTNHEKGCQFINAINDYLQMP